MSRIEFEHDNEKVVSSTFNTGVTRFMCNIRSLAHIDHIICECSLFVVVAAASLCLSKNLFRISIYVQFVVNHF